MSVFPTPLVFAAWGFRKGGGAFASAQGLADICKSNGIRTVAVQPGNNEQGEPLTTPADAATLRNAGLRVVVWGVLHAWDATTELARLGANEADWMPQVEGPGQRDLVYEQANAGLRPPAIVTNYAGAGDTAGEAARLRECGVKSVYVECYNDAGAILPFTDLERMLWQGTAYGWKESELVAVMGTYHGETPATYTATEDLGRDFGMYLAEPMTPAQWQAFGALNANTPPPKPEPPTPEDDMEPVTDNQGREAIGFAVQAAAQNWGTDEKPRARLTVCRRIAAAGNDDPKWNACRDAVVAALDAAGVPK
jgi:hypothetical protein